MMRPCYALIIPGVEKFADSSSIILALKVLGIVTLLAGGGLLAILHKNRFYNSTSNISYTILIEFRVVATM
jgi:hypothetical protein